MYKNKLLLLAIFLLVMLHSTNSQNNTNSPYTRFGYGNISETNSAEQKGMGGVALGARSSQSINTVNPASYSSVDSTRFMFDIGTMVLYSGFTDIHGSTKKLNSNIEYIAFQFPISKVIGLSAGLLPYSFSGYNFSTNHSIILTNNDTVSYTKNFTGKGGISQVFLGLSAQLLKHISVGVNGYYMYGSVENYRNLNFGGLPGYTSTTQTNSINVTNFRFRYGAQYYNTFDTKHDVTLGVIYENKKGLKSNFTQINTGVITDTTSTLGSEAFELPNVYGVGLHYTFDKRISVGIDCSLYQWNDAKFFGKTDSLNNVSKIAVGFEYLPKLHSKKYFDKVHYRAGFNMSDSYYKIDGNTPSKNIGVSLGFGFPLVSRATNVTSMINTTFEYGKVGGNSNLLKEDYFKFSLNIIFNENWFFKSKL
jgi:hypothetical protein